MNAMGHGIPNPVGVAQAALAERLQNLLPDYQPMGGMMTLVRIRPGFRDGSDPGWYNGDKVPRARRVRG